MVLHQFCKTHNLPKTTVYRDCQRLGIDTANGLDTEAIAKLKFEYSIQNEPSETSENVEETALQVIVETGNHCLEQPVPELPTVYSLESLRDSEVTMIEDPLAAAAQFLAVADSLTNAMQADIKARQQKLDQTRQAKTAIEAKQQELVLEARLYQLQTSNLNAATSIETKALQESLASLQRLGKPPVDGGSGS